MIHVLGASMPRSGHHLFEVILHNILGDLQYCEFYHGPCCKTIPCEKQHGKTSSASIFLQKSHDFELQDPIAVPNTYRIVQYRSPVPRSLSNYEVHVRNNGVDDVREFRHFLVGEAFYFCRFYKKWIEGRNSQFFLLPYEELTADPVKAMLGFLAYVDCEVNLDQVVEGVAEAVKVRGRDNVPFSPAPVYAHRYSQLPVITNFEDIVLRNCAGYFPLRYFGSSNSQNSLIGIMFDTIRAIQSFDRDRAISLAEAAYREDPNDPGLERLLQRAAATPPHATQPLPARSVDEASGGSDRTLSCDMHDERIQSPQLLTIEPARNIRWFHSFNLGNGEIITGVKPLATLQSEAAAIFSEPVVGKSVLDIGAWDGYFSFEAEKRGASDVLATDHFCWSGTGWGSKAGFEYVHSKLSSRVRSLDVDVFELDPTVLGTFDVVLFLGVLYHLRNPFGGLEQVSRMTRGLAIIETAVTELKNREPVLRFYEGKTLNNDATNFFVPNPSCVAAMLREVGFRRFKFTPPQHPPEALRGRTIIHAWK